MAELIGAVDVVWYQDKDKVIGKIILERKPIEKGSDVWVYKIRLEPQVIKIECDNKLDLILTENFISIE